MNDSNIQQELTKLKEKVTKISDDRQKAVGNLEMLQQQELRLIEEIKKANSSPETIENDINKLKEDIEKLLIECKEMLVGFDE